jgi:hypothetical protein
MEADSVRVLKVGFIWMWLSMCNKDPTYSPSIQPMESRLFLFLLHLVHTPTTKPQYLQMPTSRTYHLSEYIGIDRALPSHQP